MSDSQLSAGEISYLGVGDVGPVHGPVEGYCELVLPTLQSVDMRFGNCERQYSNRGANARGDDGQPHGRQPPEMAAIFDQCGFDAVTMANNHMYDYGPDALMDTRDLILGKGIQATGAGKNLAEARAPAIVECNGVTVGHLGYCSVIPEGGEAGPDKIGIAPLGTSVKIEDRGPHFAPRAISSTDPDHLAMIAEDIAALRERVDIVVVAFHWGILWAPRLIADYQVETAHHAIDAGADLILGHHAHVPKAIEVYKGKVCFYSLSNFCMTKPKPSFRWDEEPWKVGALRNYTDQDPDYPLLPYGKDAKRTLMAKAIFSKDGVRRVSFIPMLIDTKYRPEVLLNGDARFDDAVRYLEWASEGFDHKFTVEGDEIIVEAS
jgi:capsule synthesis protein PGA_cap